MPTRANATHLRIDIQRSPNSKGLIIDMGTVCGSGASHANVLEEERSLEDQLTRYKREAELSQEQLRRRQEELKTLRGDVPVQEEGAEAQRLKEVLQTLVTRGWMHLRSLERTLNKAPQLVEDEGSSPANDLAAVEALLSRRRAYRQELADKLKAEQSRLCNHVQLRWKSLGKEHPSSDVAEALHQLLQEYSAQLEASSTRTDTSSRQQLEALLPRLQARKETLAAEVSERRTKLAEVQAELRTVAEQQAEAEGQLKQAEDWLASLEEDLGIKRQLLVHVHGELSASERRHAKAQVDLATARERLRSDPLAAEVEVLEQRQRNLIVRQTELEQELSESKAAAQQQARRISQLEESLRETEEGTTGELDIRMHSMQSTLEELYKSIQDSTEDDS